MNGIVMQRNMRCKNVIIILDSRFTLHKLFLFTYHNKQDDFWTWLRINSVPIFEWRRFERILDHHNRYLSDVKHSYLISKKWRKNVLSCIAFQHIHNMHQTEKKTKSINFDIFDNPQNHFGVFLYLKMYEHFYQSYHVWFKYIDLNRGIYNNAFNVFRHYIQPILWLSLCER